MALSDEYEMPDDLLFLHALSQEFPIILEHMEADATKLWEVATVLSGIFRAKEVFATDDAMLSLKFDEQTALLLAYVYARGWFSRHIGGGGNVELDKDVWGDG